MNNLKLMTFGIAIALLSMSSVFTSCEKLNNDIEATEQLDNEPEFTETEEPPIEDVIEEDDYVQDVAATRILSIDALRKATNFEDKLNDCQTFKYAGYNVIKINDQDSSILIVTLSQKDTLVGEVLGFHKLRRLDGATDTIAGTDLKRIDDTHYSFVYHPPLRAGKESIGIRLTPKKGVSKLIKKSVASVTQGTQYLGSPVILGNDQTNTMFGTTQFFIDWRVGLWTQQQAGTPDVNAIETNITNTYEPKPGDFIKFKNADNKYKYGFVSAPPILTSKAGKPTKFKFYIAESNNRLCKSSQTSKMLNILQSDFPTAIKSVDNTYSAVTYRRIFP